MEKHHQSLVNEKFIWNSNNFYLILFQLQIESLIFIINQRFNNRVENCFRFTLRDLKIK